MKPARLVCFVLAVTVGACGDNGATDCACTVSIDSAVLTLACGASGCLGGMRYGCQEDEVVTLGSCTPVVDAGTDGNQCLAPQAVCDPASSTCCPSPMVADAATSAPSCDPVTRHCCVSIGSSCSTSADCCPGDVCALVGTAHQCESM